MSVPPGWPRELPPPSHDAFAARAVLWLLDNAPAPLRDEPALRSHPAVLALVVAAEIDGQIEGTRAAYASLRRELPDLDAATVEASLAAIARVGVRLQAIRREVELVEAALQAIAP